MSDDVAGLLFIGVFIVLMSAVVLWVQREERQSARLWAAFQSVPPGHIHYADRSCARCIADLERECGIIQPRATSRPWAGIGPPPPHRMPRSLPAP